MNSSRVEFPIVRIMHKNLCIDLTNHIERAMLFTAETNNAMVKYRYKLMMEIYLSLSDLNMEVHMVELIPELDEIEMESRSFRNSAMVAPLQGLQPRNSFI